MIVEVRGTNTRNKGAELMLRAIAAELADDHPVAVEPRVGTYVERARLGLLQKVESRVPPHVLARAARLVPGRVDDWMHDRYGLVLDHRIGAVLDAAGFAYSDQFDLQRSLAAAATAERLQRSGRPYVLLPQAFGPFERPLHRDAFVRLLSASALAFARERTSLEHALGVGARTDHVRLAPDFTCLLDGELPAGFEPRERLALVVPSAKLLTETTGEVAAAYLPFLRDAAAMLREAGHTIALVVHERGDVDVVARLQELFPEPAEVLAYDNALHLKGVLGTAAVVVGSRFHALVSALSQGVPAIGIGWSHKYEQLFGDYGCPQLVLDPVRDAAELGTHVAAVTDAPARDRLVAQLLDAAARERARSREMWDEVRRLLVAG